MEFAPLASAIASVASVVGGLVAVGELTRRLDRLKVGGIEIEFLAREKGSRRGDPQESADHLVASLSDISATEYALDQETRSKIDRSIDQALARLASDTEHRPEQ
jgi:hypothetical protein